MNNVQAPVAHSVDEIYRLQAVIGKYWTYFRASVEIMPSLTHMVACWTPLPCKFPCRLRLHWCEKGPYFDCQGSLLGPYFIKSWVPIGSLFLSSEVPKSFNISETGIDFQRGVRQSVEETFRVPAAVKEVHEAKGNLFTPADWVQGERTITNTKAGVVQVLQGEAWEGGGGRGE